MGEPGSVECRFVFVLVALTLVLTAGFATAAEADRPDGEHVLAFRAVLLDVSSPPPTSSAASAEAVAAIASCDPNALLNLIVGGVEIPAPAPADDDADACVVLEQLGDESSRMFLGPSELNGEAVKTARPEFQEGLGWTVTIRFTKRGARQFDRMGEAHFQQRVAIVLDDEVLTAPTIQPTNAAFESFGAVAIISGEFSKREVKEIARAIEHSR